MTCENEDMGTNKLAVSLVVPAYNEAASIDQSLARLNSVISATGRGYEILVVSDGGTDGTVDIIRSSPIPQVRLIDNVTNRGKGYSLRRGFAEATNPLVVFIDGDLDLNPSVVPGYLDRLDTGEADVIIGSKMHKDSQIDYPLGRRIASRVFSAATRVITGLSISDTQTGLKAMNRQSVSPAIAACTSDGFSFDLEFLAQVTDHGGKIVDAPVILDFDFTSTIGASNAIKALYDLRLASRGRRRRNRRRLHTGS